MVSILFMTMLSGTVAGLLAGLFGIGGGLVLVPILYFLLAKWQVSSNIIMLMSVATSLATIVFTSISSIIAHHNFGAISWSRVFQLMPGLLIGSILGAGIANSMASETLRSIFVLFLIYAGTQMALNLKPVFKVSVSSTVDLAAGVMIGLFSALLGIGGGTLTVPYLVNSGQVINRAVAISSACGFPIALSGSIAYIIMGSGKANLPDYSVGYIYLPAFLGIVSTSLIFAPIGARLAHQLPTDRLKRYFSMLIFLVAIKIMTQ